MFCGTGLVQQHMKKCLDASRATMHLCISVCSTPAGLRTLMCTQSQRLTRASQSEAATTLGLGPVIPIPNPPVAVLHNPSHRSKTFIPAFQCWTKSSAGRLTCYIIQSRLKANMRRKFENLPIMKIMHISHHLSLQIKGWEMDLRLFWKLGSKCTILGHITVRVSVVNDSANTTFNSSLYYVKITVLGW